MEISTSFITGPTVGRTPLLPSASGQRSGSGPASLPDASTHTPSAEFVAVMNKLRELAEVRNDVLQKVAERMNSGQYLTDPPAVATAAALLNDAD